jgi:hypothetical protein
MSSIDPVICVPMMPRTTTIAYMHQVIESMDIGEIDDIKSCYTNVPPEYKRVFIHLKTWYHTSNGLKVKRMLIDKKPLKVVHQGFHYWKLVAMRH